jgi:hypothetical protein
MPHAFLPDFAQHDVQQIHLQYARLQQRLKFGDSGDLGKAPAPERGSDQIF